MKLLLRPWRHYADFSGRSRRSEFWLFKITFWGVLLLGFTVSFLVADAGRGAGVSPGGEGGGVVVFAIVIIFVLASIVPNWAVTVRRLHDQGKGGGFIFLTFVPYLGFLAALIFGCLPGEEGENRFGFDPRDGLDAEEAVLGDVFS